MPNNFHEMQWMYVYICTYVCTYIYVHTYVRTCVCVWQLLHLFGCTLAVVHYFRWDKGTQCIIMCITLCIYRLRTVSTYVCMYVCMYGVYGHTHISYVHDMHTISKQIISWELVQNCLSLNSLSLCHSLSPTSPPTVVMSYFTCKCS